MKFKRLIYSYAFCILILIIFFCLAVRKIDPVTEVGYYTSLEAALADASEHSISRADCRQDQALASVNIRLSGSCRAVLLSDAVLDDTVLLSDAELVFDLNGRTLSFETVAFKICGGSVTFLGGGALVGIGDGATVCAIMVSAQRSTELTVNDIDISVSSGKNTLGIACVGSAECDITLNRCNINALSTVREGSEITAAFYTNPDTNIALKMKGGAYIADSKHRLIDPKTGASSVVGIRIQQKSGVMELDGVSAVGIHSGISSSAFMILKNSYCASPTHGGMYNGGVLAAENCVFENGAYMGECQDPEQIQTVPRLGAMYNGSKARPAVAYLDRCKFINTEASYGLVVSTNYGYQSPSVYISNTTVKDLRVDGERPENQGVVGTAYIGENVTYSLRSADGIIDTEAYKNVRFSLEWLKAQGILAE